MNATDRLRESAQNEQTCIALNDLLKAKEAECKQLRDENAVLRENFNWVVSPGMTQMTHGKEITVFVMKLSEIQAMRAVVEVAKKIMKLKPRPCWQLEQTADELMTYLELFYALRRLEKSS